MGQSYWRLLTPLLALSLFAAPSAATSTTPTPQVLNIGNGDEPKDLDPHIVTGVPEFHILHNLFEGLIQKDPKTLEPLPGAAESWKLSQDGLTYTFKLRASAKWSNGDPVTAADFIYAWTRLLTPATAAEYAYQGYYIKNGQAFNTGKLKDASQLGLKAPDAHTLVVTLERPTPFFLNLTFHPSMYPVPKKTIEKFGARWTRPENIVSNGAFALDKWELHKTISLKPNPHYWDHAKIALTQANFLPIQSADTEEKMFRSKEIDVINELPLEKIPLWQKDTTGVFQTYPYLGIYWYLVNVKKAPLDNKKVRQALALGFDREAVVKYVTRGGQMPGTVFVPPGTGGYKSNPKLPKDLSQLAQAKKLLAEAGYPDGKGMPPIEILYNTTAGHKKIAEAIQQMWKKNLGVEVKLYSQEWKVLLDSQRTMNYMLTRQGWIADYNDPNTFLDIFMSDNGNNHTGWANKKYDKLIEDALKERNQKKRWALYHQAEEILADELPTIPVYVYTRLYLKNPAVQGWHNNVEDVHPLKFVSIGR